jgi:hypothetical protein
LKLLSAWLLDYRVGDYAALHTDRPDSVLTGLLALDLSREPLVICPQLADVCSVDLLELAGTQPHPAGVSIVLSREQLFLFEGARMPHHRPSVRQPCQVLSISLGP